MATDRHACPDCGASHPIRAPKKRTRSNLTADTDLTPARCPRCSRPVLAGRIEGIDLRLDPRPLNELGYMALQAIRDRLLVSVNRNTARGRLSPRWHPRTGATIHAAHDCARPIPHELGDALIDRTRRATRTPTPTDPPPY